MAEPLLHTTGATTGANQQAYDADGNPIGSLAGALAVQLFHNGNPYQATGGGGGVTWPLAITPVLADPTPTGGWQFYVLSDGVASPNNYQEAFLMTPSGFKFSLGSETI